MSVDVPIRVAFVVHVMQVAGAEVLVRETIHRLGNRIEPTILCIDAFGSIGEDLRHEGIPVVCLNRKPNGRDFGVSRRMAHEIRERKIEVVHAHQYTPFFYSALAKPLTGFSFKLIQTEHGRHYPDVVSPLRRAVNRLVLDRLADAVNACCEFSARAMCRVDGFRGNRIDVIDNGIELKKYESKNNREELRTRLGLSNNKKYVACVARFHPVKDHPMLIRAFARVCNTRPDVDLLLAGDGPDRGILEDLVRTLGITDRVQFLGIRKDVPDLLQACDLFALTSVSEAASLTLMEAMACARPVVVTNVGGNPELVRNNVDGLLVPRGDDRACAEAMLKILNNDTLAEQFGQSSRERAMERFNIATTIAKYEYLYRRLSGRRTA